MKKTLLIALVFSLCKLANAQSWNPLGKGVNSVRLNVERGAVFALTVYNTNLYVAGGFDTAGGINANFIAKWNGISWDSLNSEIRITANSGTSAPYPTDVLTTYNNNLYVGGTMSGVGQIYTNGILEWNGVSWDSVGEGIMRDDAIYALAVYHGNLIAGGQFWMTGWKSYLNIAQWNGSSWDSLGSGVGDRIFDGFTNIYALAVYNGNLYAGGYFDSAGRKPAKNIAMWNGISWSAVSSGINGH